MRLSVVGRTISANPNFFQSRSAQAEPQFTSDLATGAWPLELGEPTGLFFA